MSLEVNGAKIVLFCIIYLPCIAPDGLGPCPKIGFMKDFNVSRFTGHWYEIERSFYLMELIRNCVAVDILAKENGRLDVSITAKSTWSGSFAISDGVAVPTRKDPSQFVYKVSSALPRVINRYLPFSGVYQVLQTDYTNYAVIYSCTNFELVHSDLIWIWGRRQEINAKTRADIYSSLQEYSLDSERLILPKDDNCTDY